MSCDAQLAAQLYHVSKKLHHFIFAITLSNQCIFW